MKPEEVTYHGGEDPQPMDRLTRIADAGRQAMYADPEWHESDKLIISVTGKREDGKVGGGLFVSGYGVDKEHEEELRRMFPDWDDVSEEEREHRIKMSVTAEVVAVLVEHAESLLADTTGVPVKIVPVQPARIDQVMPFLANWPN